MTILHANTELSESKIKKKIPFTIASKRIKLTKEVKDLHLENCKTLMEEVEDDKNEKIYHVHELEELILLKCPYYPKQSMDSVQLLSKFQWHVSQNSNTFPKICMETQNIPSNNNNLEKEE